jgi:K+ transporter
MRIFASSIEFSAIVTWWQNTAELLRKLERLTQTVAEKIGAVIIAQRSKSTSFPATYLDMKITIRPGYVTIKLAHKRVLQIEYKYQYFLAVAEKIGAVNDRPHQVSSPFLDFHITSPLSKPSPAREI